MDYSYYDRLINKRTKVKYDVTPIFTNPEAFSNLIKDFSKMFRKEEYDVIMGLEALGFIEGIIKTEEQKEAFWKGYHEHHSSDYFDKDYQEYVTFVQLIRSLSVRSKQGRNVKDLEQKIKQHL